MSFLRKKIQETFTEEISQKIFQLEFADESFVELLHELIPSLSADDLNLVLEFVVEDEGWSSEKKILFLQELLSNQDPAISEKAIIYLELYIGEKSAPLIEHLVTNQSHGVRARVFWVLAKYYSERELTLEIIDELKIASEDNEQIFLAAALYQRNNSVSSLEMRFLKDYYIQYFYDTSKEELKVSLVGKQGLAAKVIGLILWEAGIELFATGSLQSENMLWLIEK